MRFGNEQRRENEVVFLKETLHDLLVEAVRVEDAELAFELGKVIENILGFGFSQRELIFVCIDAFDQFDKCMNDEGIVLCGNGKGLLALLSVFIAFVHQVDLIQDLFGIRHEFAPFCGQRNSA